MNNMSMIIGGGTRGAEGATAPQIPKYMLLAPPDFHTRNLKVTV